MECRARNHGSGAVHAALHLRRGGARRVSSSTLALVTDMRASGVLPTPRYTSGEAEHDGSPPPLLWLSSPTCVLQACCPRRATPPERRSTTGLLLLYSGSRHRHACFRRAAHAALHLRRGGARRVSPDAESATAGVAEGATARGWSRAPLWEWLRAALRGWPRALNAVLLRCSWPERSRSGRSWTCAGLLPSSSHTCSKLHA